MNGVDLVEREFILKFGHRIIKYKGEDQDLNINTFLKYNRNFFTGSWVLLQEILQFKQKNYKKVNKEEKVFEIIQISVFKYRYSINILNKD